MSDVPAARSAIRITSKASESCELKSKRSDGRRDVRTSCGSLCLRADSDDDAEYLALMSRVVQRASLMELLMVIGEAMIDKKLKAREIDHILKMFNRLRVAKANEKMDS